MQDHHQEAGDVDQAQHDELERNLEQEQAAKLLECEKLFTQPDSIMEPGILEVLRRYLELGGSAQNAVDFLIDKYVGKHILVHKHCRLSGLSAGLQSLPA